MTELYYTVGIAATAGAGAGATMPQNSRASFWMPTQRPVACAPARSYRVGLAAFRRNCSGRRRRVLPLKLLERRHHPDPADQTEHAHRGSHHEGVREMPGALDNVSGEPGCNDPREV